MQSDSRDNCDTVANCLSPEWRINLFKSPRREQIFMVPPGTGCLGCPARRGSYAEPGWDLSLLGELVNPDGCSGSPTAIFNEGSRHYGICIQYFKEQQRYNRSRPFGTKGVPDIILLEHYQCEVSGSYGSCYYVLAMQQSVRPTSSSVNLIRSIRNLRQSLVYFKEPARQSVSAIYRTRRVLDCWG